MATYGTDLTTFSDAESGSWYECTATSPEAWNVGDIPGTEADYFIQGAGCRSSDTNNKTGICSGVLDMSSDQSGLFSSGETVVLIWHVLLPGNAMDTYANSGLRAVVGSGLSDFWWWTVGGRDKGRNPYGGWQNYAIDPSNTNRTAVGSPSGAYRYFGAAADVTSLINKGTMHGWDAIRYGRGEIYCTGTGANFGDMATYNDYNDATNGYNRFGLFQAQGGAFLWKGLMSLGQGTTGDDVTFTGTNRVIFVDDCPNTYPTFNKVEINNADSDVTWNNCSFIALGTYAPGLLEVVDNCTVAINGCLFSGMGTFDFQSNTDVLGTVFYRCSTITPDGATMTGCQVLESSVAADASALEWDVASDPDGYLDDMIFSKGSNDHHAIYLGTSSPTEVTLRNWTTSGFSASNGQNSSTIYVARTVGSVTINVVSGTGNFTYKSAGASVSIVVDPVTVTVRVVDPDGDPITGAQVVAFASDGLGDLPYQDAVTLTRSGSTVTVSHTGHNMASGQYVIIKGATSTEYNGLHQITYIDSGSYSYTIATTPSSPDSGTSTGVAVAGTTGTDGEVSSSRTYTADQNVTVRARSGSSPPYYEAVTLSDTIDNTAGLTKVVQLNLDQ